MRSPVAEWIPGRGRRCGGFDKLSLSGFGKTCFDRGSWRKRRTWGLDQLRQAIEHDPVARGRLRWSDRRDDLCTEILGSMKAQRVLEHLPQTRSG
ncbi:NAD-glutamate dehydrogenase domain-containing protein [Novosphingobium soli]|uniref:NAD-glutamate dehydrogenase domain-containing protein n=1 Tax=Novosphingobium soli TaxID=574956 RepID=A0ABV6CSZ3_9SPHN